MLCLKSRRHYIFYSTHTSFMYIGIIIPLCEMHYFCIHHDSIPPPLQKVPQEAFFSIEEAEAEEIAVTEVGKGSQEMR